MLSSEITGQIFQPSYLNKYGTAGVPAALKLRNEFHSGSSVSDKVDSYTQATEFDEPHSTERFEMPFQDSAVRSQKALIVRNSIIPQSPISYPGQSSGFLFSSGELEFYKNCANRYVEANPKCLIFFEFLRVSPGDQPLSKKPEDSA